MNEQMRRDILNRINDYEHQTIDLDDAVKRKDMPIEIITFCADTKKALARLKRKLKSSDWVYLPTDLSKLEGMDDWYMNMPYSIPSRLLDLVIRILDALESRRYEALAFYVKILVIYEMMYGFWDPSKKEKPDASQAVVSAAEKMKKMTSMAKDEFDHLLELRNRLSEQIQSVAESEKKASAMSAVASEKVSEITILINDLNAQKKGLEELRESILVKVNDADNKNTQLAAFVAKYQEDGDKLLKDISQKSTKISEQIESAQALIDQVNSKIANIDEITEKSLNGVEENYAESQKKVEEIKKMMGFVGGGVLGNSFNERKKRLSKKALFWLVISVLFLLGAIWWIYYVFTHLSANTGIVWADIIINVVKSSLAVFAFGYALNEYGKERNLQEEYAFKEAVAFTLTAYLEQLNIYEKDEMKKLLTDTVEKLYTKPVISNKEYKMMQMEPKEIAEMLKPIADVVKPLAGRE